MFILNEDGTYTRTISREDDIKMTYKGIGREIGIEEGIKQSILKTAKAMIKKGMNTKDIQDVTNLSKKEIDDLKKIK